MKKHDKYGVVEYNKAYVFALFLSILTAVAIGVGTLIYYAEAGGEGSNINTLDDAIWTSWMASSTVGFGDHYPKTWGGRSGVIFMSIVGSGFTGIIVGLVSVVVMRRFDNSITNRQNKLLIDILIQKMDRMERHLGVDESAEYIPDEVISKNEHVVLGQDDSGLYIIVNRKRGQVTTHEELETASAHSDAILTNRGVL